MAHQRHSYFLADAVLHATVRHSLFTVFFFATRQAFMYFYLLSARLAFCPHMLCHHDISRMDVEEVRALIGELQSSDTDADAATLRVMCKVASILETMTSERCRSIIRLAGRHPCLQIFMSDGWSTDLRSRFQSVSDGVRVQRTGRLRTEVVVQRTLVKANVDGEMHFGIKLERPRPLMANKCADIWSAACDHVPLLKLCGHSGVSVAVYLQDGLFSKPFGKRMRARHSLFFHPDHCPLTFEDDNDKELAWLRDWVFCWNCCAHSCSSALKWGMLPLVVGDDLIGNVHITISALLRASTGLLMSVPAFIVTYVVFDGAVPVDPMQVENMWAFLDVEQKLLDLFIKVDPRWDGKMLHVRSDLLEDSNPIDCVTTVIQYCLRFVDFSETRWCKVGESGRLFTRASLVGLDQLVKLTEKNDAVCCWHLRGYTTKGSDSVRLYLAVASLAARPTETMLLSTLEDDRFLLHADEWWSLLFEEVNYLTTVAPPLLFTSIAAWLSVDVGEYKSHVVRTALTSVGYLYLDLWKPLEEDPWRHVMGNIPDNIERLKGADVPADEVSAKMQALAVLGFESEVTAACYLVKESSLATTITEQAHASGAQLMRRHPQIDINSLVDRMTVHNGRTLFYMGRDEKAHTQLTQRLEEVETEIRNTRYVGARQAYVQLLVAEVKASRLPGGPSEHALRRSVFKGHGQHFHSLDSEQRGVLEIRASAHKKRRVDDLSLAKDHLLAQLSLLRQRQHQAQQSGIVNHLDSVRFTQSDFDRFSELWAQLGPRDLRDQRAEPPRLVPAAMEDLIQAEIASQHVPENPHPDWLAGLVTHRDLFAGTGLFSASASPESDVVYKLMLAMYGPYRAVFLECRRRPRVPMSFIRYGDYHYDDFRFVDHNAVPFLSSADIMVYGEMPLVGAHVHTVGEPLPWSLFTQFHSRKVSQTRTTTTDTRSRRPTDPEVLRLLQLEFPWLSLQELQELLTKGGGQQSARTHGGSSSSSGGVQSPGATDLPEDIVVSVSNELSALRDTVGHGSGPGHFTVKVLGGEWSLTRFQKAATDIGVYPKDKATDIWCKGVGWPPSPGQKSFSVSKFGQENAHQLATAMCRLANYYITSWIDQGSPSGFSFELLKGAYVPGPDYHAWVDTLPVNGEAFKAAALISRLCPNPVPE